MVIGGYIKIGGGERGKTAMRRLGIDGGGGDISS